MTTTSDALRCSAVAVLGRGLYLEMQNAIAVLNNKKAAGFEAGSNVAFCNSLADRT